MIRRRLNRTLQATLCACVFSCLAGPASADDMGASIKAQARALFDKARELTGKSNYLDACPKFEESQRLDPGIGTEFYLADCYEHVGRFASAWALYLEVADETAEAKMKDREDYARKRANALVPKLTRMQILVPDDVKAIPGVEIQRDGTVVKSGQWGTAVPVDPGKHLISVGAPSKRSWETTVEATGEGATVTITVPSLRDDLPPRPTVTVTPTNIPIIPGQPTVSVAPIEGESWSTPRKVAVGLGAVGVAGLVVGGVFGGLAADKAGASNKLCTPGVGGAPDQCQPAGHQLRQEANTFANGANIGVIGGSVLAAAGVVLWLVAPAAEKPAKAGEEGVRAAVVASPNGAMIQLGRAW